MKQKYTAYSALTFDKGFSTDGSVVTIEGMATTPRPDWSNDVVDPLGAVFKTPMPLLWQHDRSAPIGSVTFAKPSKDGIPFVAEIPLVKESGNVKTRIEEAIHSLKYGLVSAVSIGFRVVNREFKQLPNGGIHFKKWEWVELSLVTIPANSDAVISMIKSIDNEQRGAFAALNTTGATPEKKLTRSKSGAVFLHKKGG